MVKALLKRKKGVSYCPPVPRAEDALDWLRRRCRELAMLARDNVRLAPSDRVWRGRRQLEEGYATVPEVGLCMALRKKGVASPGKKSSSSDALQPGPLSSCSELWAFLTTSAFPDGSKRKTGRISFSCDSGVLVLSLNDIETGDYAVLQGNDLQGLIEQAELAMAGDELNWRKSKFNR